MAVKINKKRINFIEAAGRKEVNKEKSKYGKVILTGIPILLLVVMAGLNLFFFVLSNQTKAATKEIEKAMQDPGIANTVDQIKVYHSQIEQYGTYQKQLEAMTQMLSDKKQIDYSTVKTIFSCGQNKVVIRDMAYAQESQIAISVQTGDYNEAAPFVKRLRDTGLFTDISYAGFTKDKEIYNFTVGMVFNEETANTTEDDTKEGAES